LTSENRSQYRKAFLLNRALAHDGEYTLSRGGSVEVRGGALRGVKGDARTDAHRVVLEDGQIVVRTTAGAHVLAVPASAFR
jgi:hypothetical protein